MEYIKKIFVIVLVILTLNLYLPKMALAQQVFASADVPKHEPQSWGTQEEDIPTIKEKKTSGWTWLILLVLIGGAAAAAGGGGGGNGGGGGDGDDDGEVTGTW
jgi:hypothetical protein